MGRLIRKKPAVQKKRKEKQPNATDAAATTDGTASESAPLSEPARENRKKLLPALKKTGGNAVKAVAVKKENNFLDKSLQFLREVRIELKKVTWPSRKQTLGSTLVVIILVSLIAMFLGVIDIGLSGLVQLVLQQ